MGPRWEKVWKSWNDVRTWRSEIEGLRQENLELEDLEELLSTRVHWLEQEGYIEKSQVGTAPKLTKKGIMATECNESCPLILPDFYLNLDSTLRAEIIQNPNHLIVLLSAFLESLNRESSSNDSRHSLTYIKNSNIPNPIKSASNLLFSLADRLLDIEGVTQRSTKLTGDWMELLWAWLECDYDPNTLCSEYEIFEGNFVRGVS